MKGAPCGAGTTTCYVAGKLVNLGYCQGRGSIDRDGSGIVRLDTVR